MPIDLTFWGHADKKAETITKLRQFGYYVSEGSLVPGEAGRGASGSAQPNRLHLNPSQVSCIINIVTLYLDFLYVNVISVCSFFATS